MKFKEYLKHLQKLAKVNPEALEYEVVYSSDDEGNFFQPVHMGPCVGHYTSSGDFDAEPPEEEKNAVCLN